MFRTPFWTIIGIIGIFPIISGLLLKSLLWAFVLMLPLGAIFLFILHIHLELYQFEAGLIKVFGNDKVPIQADEITGITIEPDEINFHTAKYINHKTFKSNKLINREWSDFVKAIEDFATRNKLPLETKG